MATLKVLNVVALLSMISSARSTSSTSQLSTTVLTSSSGDGGGASDTEIEDCIDKSDGRGIKYRGNTNTTRSGLKCQNWKLTWPWYQTIGNNWRGYLWGVGDHNYCRNVNYKTWGTMAPWCYNADRRLKPDIKWEYCDIPRCNNPETGLTYNTQPTGTAMEDGTTVRELTSKASGTGLRVTGESRDVSSVFRHWEIETMSSSRTYRPTWWRSDAPASTEPVERDIVWWRERATLTTGQRAGLMSYHMINLIMTAFVNLFMIYIIVTRINLRQRPSIIPLLAASVIALMNVVVNWGFFIGLYMGDWWIRTYANVLCGFTEVMLEKVTLYQIMCYSIVAYEAAHALQYPSTFQRSSKKTFIVIIMATSTVTVLIGSSIYFYYNWVDTPDLFERYIWQYGESNGNYRYNRLVAVPKSRETYLWYNYWKRCQRLRIPKTWDSYLLLYSAFIPCLIGVGTMIYSLAQTYRPGLQRRNFVDAISGKHKFTPADLEELKSAVKAVTLTLMLCCILPSLDYIQKTVQSLVPSYYGTIRGILGIVQYQWYEEILRRVATFTGWVPALASLFLNPIISRARSGKTRDFATPPFERWVNDRFEGRFSGLKRMKRRVAGLFKRKKPVVVSPSSSGEV